MENTVKAWSTLQIKAIDDEKRIIEGIASTPSTDRVGDIVEPKGAQYSLPLPLLSQHDHISPIGHVISATPTDKGIKVKAQIAKDTELGYVERAWKQIKAQLVRGLSIGFRPLEYTYLDNGGIHFKEWDWYELSAVTVPANSDCSITNIKQLDLRLSGGQRIVRPTPAWDKKQLHPSRAAINAALRMLERV